MPMVVRPPGPRLTAVMRSGGVSTIGSLAPLGDLLPSGGAHAPAPAPAPHRALALDAIRLRRGLRDPHRQPRVWADPSFALEVERIRSHLAPLVTRRTLTSSFGREAFQTLDRDPPGTNPLGPIRAAYAIRWLELGSGARLPGWTRLLGADPA